MKIEMTTEELNRMALALFVEMCKRNSKGALTIEPLENVYQRAEQFTYALFRERVDVKGLPDTYVRLDVLKWVAGIEPVPDEWLLCWYNKWCTYLNTLNNPISFDNFIFQYVKSTCKQYLDELRQSEHAVFSACFLHPNANKKIKDFASDYIKMQNLRHHTVSSWDITQLLAYGYMLGVQAERAKRKACRNKETQRTDRTN